MKIIIDIPEKTNARIRSDYGHGVKCLRDEDMKIVCDAIYNGRSIKDITDEQISDAFQVAIASYWEEKSKYLTPPPSPSSPPSSCCASKNKMEQGEWKPLGDPDDLGIHSWYICSSCGFRTTWHMVDIFHFCPNCGSDNRPRILDESSDGEGKDGNVKEGDEK